MTAEASQLAQVSLGAARLACHWYCQGATCQRHSRACRVLPRARMSMLYHSYRTEWQRAAVAKVVCQAPSAGLRQGHCCTPQGPGSTSYCIAKSSRYAAPGPAVRGNEDRRRLAMIECSHAHGDGAQARAKSTARMGGAPEGGGPPRAAIQRGPCPKVPAEFDLRQLAGARGHAWAPLAHQVGPNNYQRYPTPSLQLCRPFTKLEIAVSAAQCSPCTCFDATVRLGEQALACTGRNMHRSPMKYRRELVRPLQA